MTTAANQHALIVAGGGTISYVRLNALAMSAEMVVAADSGLLFLQQSGINPDSVIGDLDSLDSDDLKNISPERIHQDTGQDDTDLEKSIRFCLREGIQSADIVGATGSRLDHSFNAISLLVKYGDRLSLTLHDHDGWARRVTQSPLSFGERIGERVSLIPAPAAYGLNSRGLRYPLNDLDLCFGSRDAISNEVISLPAEITWDKGAFLLYHQVSEQSSSRS